MNHSRIARPSDPDDPTIHFLRNHPGGGFMLRPAEDPLTPLAAMDIVNLGLDDKRRHYLAAATRNHAESSQPAGKLTTGRKERSSAETPVSG